MTSDEIKQLVPDFGAKLETCIAILIAQADSGDREAVQELVPVVELYAERHPDLMVRYMARCEMKRCA